MRISTKWVIGLGSERVLSLSYNLLVVDDDKDLLEMMILVLELEGFNVTSARSGEEAIRAALNAKFDLCISDLKMPGISGAETLVELLKIQPSLPVLIMTGYVSSEAEQSILNLGARGLLHKPFKIERLFETIKSVAAT